MVEFGLHFGAAALGFHRGVAFCLRQQHRAAKIDFRWSRSILIIHGADRAFHHSYLINAGPFPVVPPVLRPGAGCAENYKCCENNRIALHRVSPLQAQVKAFHMQMCLAARHFGGKTYAERLMTIDDIGFNLLFFEGPPGKLFSAMRLAFDFCCR